MKLQTIFILFALCLFGVQATAQDSSLYKRCAEVTHYINTNKTLRAKIKKAHGNKALHYRVGAQLFPNSQWYLFKDDLWLADSVAYIKNNIDSITNLYRLQPTGISYPALVQLSNQKYSPYCLYFALPYKNYIKVHLVNDPLSDFENTAHIPPSGKPWVVMLFQFNNNNSIKNVLIKAPIYD